MRRFWFIAFLFLWACSGGSSDDESTDTTQSDDTAQVESDTTDDTMTIPDGQEQDVAGDNTDGPVEYPTPAQPVPELAPGLYAFSDGTNEILLATSENTLFLLSASFQCTGDGGCIFQNNFAPLSCNKAYEKGYYGTITDGVFVLEGVKDTDKLYGAIQDTNTISMVYELQPDIPCCTKTFAFDAIWADAETCDDFDQPDCDIYTDANCDEGFNCILNENEQPTCVLAGNVPAGEPCATQGVCEDGKCMALANDTENHCYKYCQSASDCLAGGSCLGITGALWKVCTLPEDAYDKCNLLDQDCADPNKACYTFSSVIDDPTCLDEGTGEKGDQCNHSTDCKAGYDCIGGSTCRKLCNTDGGEPSCDSEFTSCVPLVYAQNAGYCGD